MKNQYRLRLGVCLIAVGMVVSVHAEVKLAAPFGDHMVLQQGQPVPVWGKAAPGEKITVTFGGQSQSAVAASNGTWRVDLKPMKADASPRDRVVAGASTVTCSDVLVGEVWLASGQSNMAMAMKSNRRGPVLDADAEIAAANWPNLRLFQVPVGEEAKSPAVNAWKPCSPDVVPSFSAVAYFYGREIQTTLKVPVGMISAALGGSAIVPWTPPDGKLYEGCVKPLIPYGMRGMIWYQGEADPRLSYSNDMRTLVTRLRGEWGIGEFPVYYVQIAPAYDFKPNELPVLWQAQLAALDIPNTYMSPSADLGVNLHPPDKHTVGRRLARIALALTYRQTKEEYSGPVFRTAKIEKGVIRLAFDHAEGLRCSDDGALTWFTVAGSDRVFHPATAKIEGASVVVSSAEVPEPVAVRFAWDKLAGVNLVNGAGLPAYAFRTDDWPVNTEEPKPFHADLMLPRGAAVADLDAARPQLDKAVERTFQRGGREYAKVALAVAGESVLMRMRVLDYRIGAAQTNWAGASLDIYLCPGDSNRVRQVVFELQGPGRAAKATGYEMGSPRPGTVPGAWRVATVSEGAYTFEAALPLSYFGVAGDAKSFLVDAAVNAAPCREQRPEYLWLYSPQFAFSRNGFFAQVSTK